MGLVRALRAHKGVAADAELWANDVSREYREILMAGAVEKLEARIGRSGETEVKRKRKGMSAKGVREICEWLFEMLRPSRLEHQTPRLRWEMEVPPSPS